MAPANRELFSQGLILFECPMNSNSNERTGEGRAYTTFGETSVAMGTYRDGNAFENSLDEAIQMCTAPSPASWMLDRLYQASGA